MLHIQQLESAHRHAAHLVSCHAGEILRTSFAVTKYERYRERHIISRGVPQLRVCSSIAGPNGMQKLCLA